MGDGGCGDQAGAHADLVHQGGQRAQLRLIRVGVELPVPDMASRSPGRASEIPRELPDSLGRRRDQHVPAPQRGAARCRCAVSNDKTTPPVEREHILQFFEYIHLPQPLQKVSSPFFELANDLVRRLPRNPERTVALRKLLEAKDAAVRASIARMP